VNDNWFLAELFAAYVRAYGARAKTERFAFQHGCCVEYYLDGCTTWLFVRDSNFVQMACRLHRLLRSAQRPPPSVFHRIMDDWPDDLLWDGVSRHGSVFPGVRS
jgi:hypothetical protein